MAPRTPIALLRIAFFTGLVSADSPEYVGMACPFRPFM